MWLIQLQLICQEIYFKQFLWLRVGTAGDIHESILQPGQIEHKNISLMSAWKIFSPHIKETEN